MSDHRLAAYEELKIFLLETLEESDNSSQSGIKESILGRIHESGSLDETILENLIYIVETGRFAVYSLMRWATKYTVDDPKFFEQISTDQKTFSNEKDCIAQTFVHETLRLNQIERILRWATMNFVFENYLFPKGSIVQLCLWESHKSPEVFPDPFSFNPLRFLDKQFTLDEFAPLGIGSHHCPIGAASIQICRLYLHCLATNYSLEAIGNGHP